MCKPKKIPLYLYILCAKRLLCVQNDAKRNFSTLLNNLNAMRHILHYTVKGTSSQCTLDRVNCVGHFVNIALISKTLIRHVHRVDRVTACDSLENTILITCYIKTYFSE